MNSSIACTTLGHNPQRFTFKYNELAPLCLKIKTALEEQIISLYKNGVRVFYTSCAVGVDTWAAEIVIELKRQTDYSDIELFSVIPFPEHPDRFTAGQRKRYQNILRHCSGSVIICNRFSPAAYKRTNYYMIDRSAHLLAVYDQDKSERGVLLQSMNYAKKKGLHITFIHPDNAVALENMND